MIDKLKLLENKYDVCGGSKEEGLGFIYDVSTPRGKCPMFKTLQSNACSYDCKYCHNNKKVRNKTASYEPDELARTFIVMQRQHNLCGLFLSSGVAGDANKSTEKMIESVKIIRNNFRYSGYIHFKVLPGVSYDLIKEASGYVDRVSINIETPNKSRLQDLSDIKDYKIDILRRQSWIHKLHNNQTTQMIVGAGGESDLEVLKMVDWEYKSFRLRRIYYSPFSPVKGTALGEKEATSVERTNRLYNVDFMLRLYGIKLDEFKEVIDKNNNLLKGDPKINMARYNFDGGIDVNSASWEELVRIPGIGPQSANRILDMQKKGVKIEHKRQLAEIGIRIKGALPFIELDGWRQKMISEF